MSNAAAIADIQSRHRFERERLHDAHENQHRHLRELQHQQREREREEAKARTAQPPKHGGQQHTPVRDDDTDAKERAKGHAELDARERQERDAMTARHKREIEAERNRPTSSAGPDRSKGPSGPGALGAVFSQLSAAPRAEYERLRQNYADQRKSLNQKQDGEQQRHARYGHERSAKQMQEAREEEHRKINDAER